VTKQPKVKQYLLKNSKTQLDMQLTRMKTNSQLTQLTSQPAVQSKLSEQSAQPTAIKPMLNMAMFILHLPSFVRLGIMLIAQRSLAFVFLIMLLRRLEWRRKNTTKGKL
jgi:hypothetical protein